MANKEEDGFVLDDAAEQLYRRLDGIDDSLRVVTNMKLESELMQFLQQEEEKRDLSRVLMGQAVAHFVDILIHTTPADLEKGNDRKVAVLINTLRKIAENSGMDCKLTCRYRGQRTDDSQVADSEACDYELALDDVLLDSQVARIVEQRAREKAAGLNDRLTKAFTAMSRMRIFNFAVRIKADPNEADLRRYAKTLRVLVRFYKSTTDNGNFYVLDEYDKPDVNLTLLAATNNVLPGSLQDLVNKIKPQLLGPDSAPELVRFPTVYDVVVASRRYRAQLPKPAIEVNSVHQLLLNSRLNPKHNAKAVQVSRLVLSRYGADPQKVSEIISSISEEGYHNIQGKFLGRRLSRATEFLELAQKDLHDESLQNEALHHIEGGLKRIPDEVYSELTLEGDQVSTVDHEGRKTKWLLHKKILGLLRYFKQRALTKGKVRDINNRAVRFNDVDYSVIARDCGVSREVAEHLIALLKESFRENGRFRRSSFEKNIPEFLCYEENVFEFLWYYMKGLRLKDDRIAFLNAIQILVGRLRYPEKALNVLLEDLFSPTAIGRFSDRNGFILANVLLRRYNKEENSNIELTPEEVLHVREGLNNDMVRVGRDFFNKNPELVVQKIKRMTELMLKLSIDKAHQEKQMQLRFLIYLMREIVVFCSLIGGGISQSTLQGVVTEFGNPHSSFYRELDENNRISQGLKLLQVAVRGLKRFNDPVLLEMLGRIAGMERHFVELCDNPECRNSVKKVLGRVVDPD